VTEFVQQIIIYCQQYLSRPSLRCILMIFNILYCISLSRAFTSIYFKYYYQL